MASHGHRDDGIDEGMKIYFPDLHNRSHGESSLTLIDSRMVGDGFCLLDEPESPLSFHGQLKLLATMHHADHFKPWPSLQVRNSGSRRTVRLVSAQRVVGVDAVSPVAEYEEVGHIFRPGLLSAEEAATINDEVDRIVADGERPGLVVEKDGRTLRSVFNPHL